MSIPALPGILVDFPRSGGTCIVGNVFCLAPGGNDAVGLVGFRLGIEEVDLLVLDLTEGGGTIIAVGSFVGAGAGEICFTVAGVFLIDFGVVVNEGLGVGAGTETLGGILTLLVELIGFTFRFVVSVSASSSVF